MNNDALKALERRDYERALALLEGDLATRPEGKLHALAGLASFQLERYDLLCMGAASSVALSRNFGSSRSHGAHRLTSTYTGSLTSAPGKVRTGRVHR